MYGSAGASWDPAFDSPGYGGGAEAPPPPSLAPSLRSKGGELPDDPTGGRRPRARPSAALPPPPPAGSASSSGSGGAEGPKYTPSEGPPRVIVTLTVKTTRNDAYDFLSHYGAEVAVNDNKDRAGVPYTIKHIDWAVTLVEEVPKDPNAPTVAAAAATPSAKSKSAGGPPRPEDEARYVAQPSMSVQIGGNSSDPNQLAPHAGDPADRAARGQGHNIRDYMGGAFEELEAGIGGRRMNWVKANWLIIVLGVVALTALPTMYFFATKMNKEQRAKLDREVQADIKDVSASKVTYSVPDVKKPEAKAFEITTDVNEILTKRYADARTAIKEESALIGAEARKFNEGARKPLIDGIFPKPAEGDRSRVMNLFGGGRSRSVCRRALLDGANAKGPVNPTGARRRAV